MSFKDQDGQLFRPSWLGIMPLLPTADAHTWLFGCVPHAICSNGILPAHKLVRLVPRAIALAGYTAKHCK